MEAAGTATRVKGGRPGIPDTWTLAEPAPDAASPQSGPEDVQAGQPGEDPDGSPDTAGGTGTADGAGQDHATETNDPAPEAGDDAAPGPETAQPGRTTPPPKAVTRTPSRTSPTTRPRRTTARTRTTTTRARMTPLRRTAVARSVTSRTRPSSRT